MTTATPPRRSLPFWLRVPLAPAVWLERARGRWRLALLLLYVMIVVPLGALLWRAVSLRDLPDIGDPFDVAEFRARDVAPERNAYPLYREAAAKSTRRTLEISQEMRPFTTGQDEGRWAVVGPLGRDWLEANRESLEIWRRATERPECMAVRPSEWKHDTPPTGHTEYPWAARLEAARLVDAGDLAGAWGLYRAMLRCARHGQMMTVPLSRWGPFAAIFHGDIERWANDPRVDGDLLRRAIADVEAVGDMPAPAADSLKLEYLVMMSQLDHPHSRTTQEIREELSDFANESHWYQRLEIYQDAAWFFRREPERSRRVLRLMFANWLAQADRPWDSRPPLARPQPILQFYGPDPADVAVGRALTPDALSAWFDSTLLAKHLYPQWLSSRWAEYTRVGSRDATALGGLRFTLAEQIFLREHGRPPKSVKELVGPYLKDLPEGFEEATPVSPLK